MNATPLLLCLSLSMLGIHGCADADVSQQPTSGSAQLSDQVIRYPTEWIGAQPHPEMRGKRLGIISHLFVNAGAEQAARDALARVVDIAIQEPTCLVLKAAQSMNDPLHFILYEEWSDYDEFFSVQLTREYRSDFSAWLSPLNAKPAAPEFFEIYHDVTADNSMANDAFMVISSTYMANTANEAQIRNEFMAFADRTAAEPGNRTLVAQQSFNDSNHLILYEEWSNYDDFLNTQLRNSVREDFFSSIRDLNDATNDASANAASIVELFEIIYDPGK